MQKTILLVLLTFILGPLSVSLAQNAPPAVATNLTFETALPDNVELSDGLTIVDNQLVMTTGEGQFGSITVYHATVFSDYVLEVEMFVVGGSVSLWMREQADNIACGYVLKMTPGNSAGQIGYTRGDTCDSFNELGVSNNIINRAGEWMTVRVEVRGNVMRGFVDGMSFIWANMQTYNSGASTTIQVDPQSEVYLNSLQIINLRRNTTPVTNNENVPPPPAANSGNTPPPSTPNNIGGAVPFAVVTGEGAMPAQGAAPSQSNAPFTAVTVPNDTVGSVVPPPLPPPDGGALDIPAGSCTFSGLGVATYAGPSRDFPEIARINAQNTPVNEQARDGAGSVWWHITGGDWVPALEVVTSGDCAALPDVTGQ